VKLNEAVVQVDEMKIGLAEEEKNLKVAEEATNKLLVKVQAETAKADKKVAEVGLFKQECMKTKDEIDEDTRLANIELAAAMPFVYEAEAAAKSIQPKDIGELRTMKSLSDHQAYYGRPRHSFHGAAGPGEAGADDHEQGHD
jgi:dynein heavy chain